MPPKLKFTKQEIVTAALNLTRREGLAALTARKLGNELRTSSRPVFTAFQNMEEVQKAVKKAARTLYDGYIAKGLTETPAFKGVGMQYIRFAKEEPQLFSILFMSQRETVVTLDKILPAIDLNSDRILSSIQEQYGLSQEKAKRLYKSMWIFSHGIACLCATGMTKPTEDETSGLLSAVFTGVLIKLKKEDEENA